MAVSIAGLSTLGVKFGYAAESSAGVQPTAYKWLERCNQIAGITLETENIDASALEDFITKNIAGRQDTGGTWGVTFNLTAETTAQLEAMISEYQTAKLSNLNMWFEVWHPEMSKGFYVIAEPPKFLPMPEFGQNELQTIELTFTIVEYKGQLTAYEPTDSAVAVTGVTLNKDTTTIAAGSNETLTATVAPDNASNKSVSWSSTDTSVATVDSTGKVVGVAAGTAYITVTTASGNKTDTCEVTVTA